MGQFRLRVTGQGPSGACNVLHCSVPPPPGLEACDAAAAMRREVTAFVRSYTKLVRIRLHLVPTLLDGRAPIDVLQAESVEHEAIASMRLT